MVGHQAGWFGHIGFAVASCREVGHHLVECGGEPDEWPSRPTVSPEYSQPSAGDPANSSRFVPIDHVGMDIHLSEAGDDLQPPPWTVDGDACVTGGSQRQEDIRIDAVPWRHDHGMFATGKHAAKPGTPRRQLVDNHMAWPVAPEFAFGLIHGGMVVVRVTMLQDGDIALPLDTPGKRRIRLRRDNRQSERDCRFESEGEQSVERGCLAGRIIVAPPECRRAFRSLPRVEFAAQIIPVGHAQYGPTRLIRPSVAAGR